MANCSIWVGIRIVYSLFAVTMIAFLVNCHYVWGAEMNCGKVAEDMINRVINDDPPTPGEIEEIFQFAEQYERECVCKSMTDSMIHRYTRLKFEHTIGILKLALDIRKTPYSRAYCFLAERHLAGAHKTKNRGIKRKACKNAIQYCEPLAKGNSIYKLPALFMLSESYRILEDESERVRFLRQWFDLKNEGKISEILEKCREQDSIAIIPICPDEGASWGIYNKKSVEDILTETLKILITNSSLFQDKEISLVERNREFLEQCLKELGFNITDLFDRDNAVKFGEMIGAERLVISKAKGIVRIAKDEWLSHIDVYTQLTSTAEAKTEFACKMDILIDIPTSFVINSSR